MEEEMEEQAEAVTSSTVTPAICLEISTKLKL